MDRRAPGRAVDRSRLPTRRRLLRWVGIGGLVGLSGCTRDVGEQLPENEERPTAELQPSLPVRERRDVLEERIDAAADEDVGDEEAFASAVGGYELEVESVERDRDVLTIEYINTELHAEGTLHHVAPIAGAFAALVESGYEAVALEITVLDDAPASYGSATVETEWARGYVDGDLTAAEYGELVANTIESTRHPPEVGVTPDA